MTDWSDVTAPGFLPLGLIKLEHEGRPTLAMLGASLKHVLVKLSARPAASTQMTGARAPLALAYLERFANHHAFKLSVEVEIEWAIPALLGLGSEAVLALAAARAVAPLYGVPDDAWSLFRALELPSHQAPVVWSFDRGGLVLTEMSATADGTLPPLTAWRGLEHKATEAWAFAMFHPLAPQGTPASLETDRLTALLAAAPCLSVDTGRIVESQLWPAVEADDERAFGQALMRIQALNDEALRQAGAAPAFSPTEQSILDLLRDNGAHAWGRSPTGLAFYGLVRGQTAAADMKKKLLAHMGHHAGTTMSTAIDSTGARREARPAPPALRLA
jgi:predicted sugar kinase